MTQTFEKRFNFSKKVTDLPDHPSPGMTPADIKAYFQTPSDEMQYSFNKLVDALNQSKLWTEDKLADGSVSRRTIANGAVGSDQLDPNLMNYYGDIYVKAILSDTIISSNYPIIAPENDDTGRLNRMVADADSTGKVIDLKGKTYTVTSWTIAKDNIKVFGNGAKIIQKADYGSTVSYTGAVNITGKFVSLFDTKIDGNQWNYTSKKNQYGLNVTGDNVLVSNVEIVNTCSVGLMITGKYGKYRIVNVHDNAASGLQTSQASYLEFNLCHFDRNGFGYQVAYKKPNEITAGLTGFGTAVRYRSHHIQFIGCTALENGRDGFNVNQGSHDIKFIGCKAIRNNDGGFTIAADNDSTGLPGEGESPFNIEYDPTCEAANNWNSGLAIFQPAHNVFIKGRYYNNHRLAGHLDSAQTSFYNGIFVASGSKHLNIDAECFDDRQTTTVSAISGNPMFTVNSWTSGTIENYPKVAVYAADGTFKGYAIVTAESGTSITLSVAGLNYSVVNLANIVIGDTITQAVQKYGVYFSAPSSGMLNVRGYGNQFYKVLNTPIAASAPFGGNFRVLNAITDNENYLVNGGFDADTASISNGWAYNGGSGYAELTQAKSTAAMKFTLSAATGYANASLTKGIKPFLGTWARFAGWVYSSVPNTSLRIVYTAGSSPNSEVKHPGDGKWHYLEVWAYIPDTATAVIPRVYGEGSGNIVYFDSLTFLAYQLKDSERPPIPYFNE